MVDPALKAARAQIQAKSLGVALVLALIFGGPGAFYVSVTGGIICTIIEAILWLLAVLTLGMGTLLIFPFHCLMALYVAVAVNGHNKRLLADLES